MTAEELKDLILEESKKGNIVINAFEGIITCGLEDFINQPAEGMLYDLNRDGATVLTFIGDPKWVNDYAVGMVITALKDKIQKLVEQLNTQHPKQ
ncbi:MAG: hypothetical protein ACTHMM_18375 [Agriterribacter sp.]